MLLEFTVGNYRSFKEDTTFSFVASKLKSSNPALNTGAKSLFSGGEVLHSAVFYGANASGKSNFIKAILFFTNFIKNSAREGQSLDSIKVQPYLFNKDTVKEPSFFEIIFYHKGIQYRYGAELDAVNVQHEWLYRRKKREVLLFERIGQKMEVRPTFASGKALSILPRSNALLLSVADQWGIPLANLIMEWFHKIGKLSGLSKNTMTYTAKRISENTFKGQLRELILSLDLGLSGIKVAREKKYTREDVPDMNIPEEILQKFLNIDHFQIESLHLIYDDEGKQIGVKPADFEIESDGTKKLFSLAGPILHTLNMGRLLIIDEFDSQLHPMISRALIGLFQNKKTNPNGAQLIIATHDTNLLSNDLFRRDQIWFFEKSTQGYSCLYSLASFKVRNDASFERDYFRGRYGAVPFLGGLERIVAQPLEGDH